MTSVEIDATEPKHRDSDEDSVQWETMCEEECSDASNCELVEDNLSDISEVVDLRQNELDDITNEMASVQLQIEDELKERNEETEEEPTRPSTAEEPASNDSVIEHSDVESVSSWAANEVEVIIKDEEGKKERIDHYNDETFEHVGSEDESLEEEEEEDIKDLCPDLQFKLDSSVEGYMMAGDVVEPSGANMRLLKPMEFPCVFLGSVGSEKQEAYCELFLKNSSPVAWPADTVLRLIAGNGAGVRGSHIAHVGACNPQETVKIQLNFSHGECPPGFSFWCLCTGNDAYGTLFCVQRV